MNRDSSGAILLIDDEPQILKIYKTLLSGENFLVTTASSYEEALTLVDQQPFQLIITDLRMSGKSGIDLIRDVRSRGLDAEVVVITGFPELETAREAMRHGALDYLTKPVFKEDLFRVCHFAIGHHLLKRKKATMEQHMEAVMRSLQDGVIMLDLQGRILYANQAANRLCQLAEASRGMDLARALTHTREALKKALLTLLTGEAPSTTIHSGTVQVSREPLLDDDQNPLGDILLLRQQGTPPVTAVPAPSQAFHGIIGQCPAMQRVFHLVETLAGLDTTVLVTGESGTGKEMIAEVLHKLGNRKQYPFVAVNCAAIPDTLLESELFGHVRGSFTGAIKDHMGKLQQADRGVIFLDEIGDTSPAMQVRLLRFLQKREIQRVGEEKTIVVNARVVAATNQDLAAKVRDNTFRQDLYYRLKVVEIHLPPLRERKEDLSGLIDYYLGFFSRKFEKRVTGLAPAVFELFQNYPWPGNIRELVHVLERAVILTREETVTLDAVSLEQSLAEAPALAVTAETDAENFEAFKLSREILLAVLHKKRWNVTETARELGVSRTTIYRKMHEFGIGK